MKDWLIRAIKTFVQATVSYFVINGTMVMTHIVNWDFADWKSWLLPVITGALAAGIAAVWNIILESFNSKKIEEEISEIMKEIEDK